MDSGSQYILSIHNRCANLIDSQLTRGSISSSLSPQLICNFFMKFSTNLQLRNYCTTNESRILIYSLLSMYALGVYPFLSKAPLTFQICMEVNRQQYIINKFSIFNQAISSSHIVQKMLCATNSDCPLLYDCNNGLCHHQPITQICPQIIICIFLIPFLMGLSNRIGISTIWIVYPTLMTLMAYKYTISLELVCPLSFASSFVMLYLCLKDKSQTRAGPAINFYIVNATLPTLITSINIGLILAEIVPLIYVFVIGFIASVVFLILAYRVLKDIEAEQKINVGHFRKMLPQRLQNSKKINLTIQLALIQQADSQVEQHQNQLSPTRKTKIRRELMQQYQNDFPYTQLLICLACFLCYQCLALSLPQTAEWLFGVRDKATKFWIGFSVLFGLMIVGEVYLYKFYVQPIKIKEQKVRVDLGVKVDAEKMAKICAVGFIGGILQGLIGFGFSFTLFFYLLHTDTQLKDTIATCGFLTIFISASFTLSSIFCGNFNWLHYLIILLLTLLVMIGFQYLLNTYIQNNTKTTSINSTLITMVGIVLIINLFSIMLAFSLSWVRFGLQYVDAVGTIEKC